MHFRIKDIEREHIVELDDTLTMPQIASESSQIKEVDDVHAHIQLAVEPALFHATGTVDTNVVYECSRCLTEFKQPLHAVLEESFTQNPAKANEDIHLVSGDTVNLDPYIEEALFLAVEYRPLCRDDCKGLCPTCGCNWNTSKCSCDNQKIDPRLSALKDLLSSDESG